MYPLEPLPTVQLCGQRLLQGYSAAWLGLVPAAPHTDKSPGSDQADVTSPPEALLQPVGQCYRVLSHCPQHIILYIEYASIREHRLPTCSQSCTTLLVGAVPAVPRTDKSPGSLSEDAYTAETWLQQVDQSHQ